MDKFWFPFLLASLVNIWWITAISTAHYYHWIIPEPEIECICPVEQAP